MYIEPNSTIKLYSGIRLDSDYNNTLYFDSVAEQNAFFHSGSSPYFKKIFTRQSYQRVNKGSMKIEVCADDIYDCNYLAFQNTAYGNKWFYAFITGIEYINNQVSLVTFSIDVMQTYLKDFTLLESFVEREHSISDKIGEHILPEPVDPGYYITNNVQRTQLFKNMCMVVTTAVDFNSAGQIEYVEGDIRHGIYSGMKKKFFDATEEGVNELNNWIKRINEEGKLSNVMGITYMPKTLVPDIFMNGITQIFDIGDYFKDLNGYTPKNKKLYTHPYNVLYITNGTIGIVYKFERFGLHPSSVDGHPKIEFTIYSTSEPTASPTLIPKNYNGVENNYENSVNLGTFPSCAFNSDFYTEYAALHSNQVSMQAVTNVVSGAGSAISGLLGNPILGTLGVIQSVVNIGSLYGDLMDKKNYPAITHGAVENDILSALKAKDFYLEQRTIPYDYAKMIDNFFTMYGYSARIVKVPNINARERWTYTKTVGCNIVSKMPSDDAQKITEIFDKGITFWKNHNEIGNYSLANNPL